MQVIAELKRMSEERFLAIYEALLNNGFGPLDGDVAKALKFRPQAIKKLPLKQRARRARLILERGSNAETCYELFGGYLLKAHKELVLSFLDGTGVEHEDGMISSVEECRPDPEKIAAVVAELDREHPPEEVTLYLSICAEQWPSVPEIQAAWQARQPEQAPSG